MEDLITLYNDQWGFPQCVGAIDGMHVSIKAPTENAADYYNRKHFHSIISVICVSVIGNIDSLTFSLDMQDGPMMQEFFANSSVYQLGVTGQLLPVQYRLIAGQQIPLVLIDDPAYPLLPWLLKPFTHRGHLTAAQTRFNYRLSRGRMTIEKHFWQGEGNVEVLAKKERFPSGENKQNCNCLLHSSQCL